MDLFLLYFDMTDYVYGFQFIANDKSLRSLIGIVFSKKGISISLLFARIIVC